MPTAGRLVAALALGLAALVAALAYVPELPEGVRPGWLLPAAGLAGLIVGWRGIGRRAGQGWRRAPASGLQGMAATVLWLAAGFAIVRMIELALQRHYPGPVEAVLDVPLIALGYLRPLLEPGLVALLAGGGAAAGLAAEYAARRWR